MSGKNFETIKELIEFRGSCPLCKQQTTMQLTAHDLFSKLGGSKDKNGLETLTLKEDKSGKIKFKELGVELDIDSNEIIFQDTKTCSETGCYVSFDVVITCDHEHIGRALECRGSFSFYPDNFDISWKGPIKYPLEEINIDAELIVAYEICDNTANVVKIINNYAADTSIISLAYSDLDKEFVPKFTKINRQALSDHFLKFKDPNKIMGRINSIMLMK